MGSMRLVLRSSPRASSEIGYRERTDFRERPRPARSTRVADDVRKACDVDVVVASVQHTGNVKSGQPGPLSPFLG